MTADGTPNICDVAVIGGGTSGLALATELKHLGVKDVTILERESDAGGVPRHCGHYPFGIMEFKRLMKGPDYARALVKEAIKANVDIQTGTTVTALHPGGRLEFATQSTVSELQAKRVVLCTGVRESSRAQRFIGGERPQGVISTGALQSMVYLHGKRPFRRPVILGTELVSLSAIMTCWKLGIRPVAMIEENERMTAHQIMRPFPMLMRIPVVFGAINLQILGHQQVEAVEFYEPDGNHRIIETDGVIVSGKFRPESALLRMSHIEVDPATGGPNIDQYGRSSDPAYFCTGNLLRPVETSSWCWREAVEAAKRVADDIENPVDVLSISFPLRTAHPAIRFVVPQRLNVLQTQRAMTCMQIRLRVPAAGRLTANSGGKVLWSKYLKSRPERRILAPLKPLMIGKLDAPVDITLEDGD